MAAKKELKKQEKDKYRNRYRTLKELRWWAAGLLVICISLNVWAAIDRGERQETLDGLATGEKYRDAVVITGGETKLDLMSLSYYFYDAYYDIIESDRFTSDYGAYGLDPEKPLKDLEYTPLRTWFDELLGDTYTGVEQAIRYAELARKEGTTLDAEDEKAVEEEIKAIEKKAKTEGMSLANYLDYRYCAGMTVDDLRTAISLYKLGEKQYTLSIDEMLKCSDEEIEAYYEANKSSLLTADYAFFKFYAEKKSDLEEKAKKFTACKTVEEFMALIEEDVKAQGASDKEASDYLEQSQRRIDYTEKDGVSDWAFSEDRETGDTFVEYGENSCAVYWLMRAGKKVTRPSANARSILISTASFKNDVAARAFAEELFEKAKNNGTEEYFIELVKENSFDLNTAYYGGEYADIVPGDVVAEYEAWVFEEERKYGDIELVKTGEDYHIIFFLSHGDECWKVTAKNALVDKRQENFTASLEKDIPVTRDEYFVNENLADDLATERDRGYVAEYEDGKLVYRVYDGVFSFFNVMLCVSIIVLVATVWCFAETVRLNKKYSYKS